MDKSIHKLIIRNLLLGGITISILTGITVYVIENNRLVNYVAALATESSLKYFEYYNDYYRNPSDVALQVLRKSSQNTLDHDLFVLVEIYDNNLKKIIVENIKEIDTFKYNLNRKFSTFIMQEKIAHEKTSFDGQFYIKVMSPIRDMNSGKTIGHFGGIYHVSEDKITEIRKRSLLSVLQSVLIVLVTTILLYPIILRLSERLTVRSYELLESNINTIKSLGGAIAKRDSDTNSHNYRVTIYSVRLAEKLSLNNSQIKALIKGAFLHDVGKIGISDNILLKPGKLTNDEFEIMKRHVILGEEIIRNNDWLNDATDVVVHHHEKLNGKGYMAGLQGESIPANARIFAIADVFDALTSSRPYKEAFPLEKSIAILKEGSGSHFDPAFLAGFELIAEELYSEISNLENEQILNKQLNLLISRYFKYCIFDCV